MKYLFKLNVVSILYALMVFVPLELMLNVYRISRLTDWGLGTVITLIGVTVIIQIISGTMLLTILTKKWMGDRIANFWTVILWVPYFVLFVKIITTLIPTTYQGDIPSPGTGFLVIGALLVYPIYIIIINFIGNIRVDKTINTA